MSIPVLYKKVLLLTTIISIVCTVSAQKTIKGVIKDKQSDEPIPFASVVMKHSGRGVLTDSLGKFSFDIENWEKNDTLQIFTIGYVTPNIPVQLIKDSSAITVKLQVKPSSSEAVVKLKYNRALWFWKKIIKNKPRHDKAKLNNYSYEIYNRLELDLNNFSKEKLEKNKLLKPLNFVLEFIDSTSEDKPFLPVYLTETLSDYYYQKDPHRIKEVIKAAKTNGIDNESIVQQLGGMYQNIDAYGNYILVFNKQFIGPFNDNADKYYNFKLLDTQYLNKRRLVHFRFTPKHLGNDVFEGDCWIHDSSFSIQKITLRPAIDANINFIGGLSLIQEFKLINDSIWFLYKDKFVADIIPLGSRKIGMKGRKTTTYKYILLNDSSVTKKLEENKQAEEVTVAPKALDMPDSFWTKNRHEELSKSEKTVYKVLDTLENNPTYIHYRNLLNFISTGTKDLGNVRIGPWYYWYSANNWEGSRVRFDLSTNTGFNKHLYLTGYLAYGTADHQLKEHAEVKYLFKNKPWSYVSASYTSDLDNGQIYYDQLGTDNLFATIMRRPNIPYKFQQAWEKKVEYYQETFSGFHFGVSALSKQYEALENLPDKTYFTNNPNDNPFNTFETSVRLRFAYLEQFIEYNFVRVSLGSDYPIAEIKYTHGWPDVLGSKYTYDKLDFSVSGTFKTPPYGYVYYNVFAGKVFGTLPYQFLQIAPGNEMFYYNRYAFNLMNRFEYISDQFIGFNIEHFIGSSIFKYIPITRKLKFRHFWTAKGIIGSLSDENKKLNYVGNYPFRSFEGNPYLELGTGVDNILKFFRVDFVWRVTPSPIANQSVNRFGAFGSFRLTF